MHRISYCFAKSYVFLTAFWTSGEIETLDTIVGCEVQERYMMLKR